MARPGWRAAIFAALCLAATLGHSHDSWLSPSRHDAPPGQLVLELATGNRFPVQQFSQTPASVLRSQCVAGNGSELALRALKEEPQWLDFAVAAGAEQAPPLACWLELRAAQIELEPRIVDVYFAEIKATAANRQAWAALRERGLPWRESYRKFARIELAAMSAASPAQIAAARRPAGLGLEIMVLGEQPIAPGQSLAFQVLRDGRPLPDFAVELISERSALGIWRRTDVHGMLRHSLPFAGRWLLRGTELQLTPASAQTWESRFVTLAIEAR
jgi:uncharacterized GH25 family protein